MGRHRTLGRCSIVLVGTSELHAHFRRGARAGCAGPSYVQLHCGACAEKVSQRGMYSCSRCCVLETCTLHPGWQENISLNVANIKRAILKPLQESIR